MRTTIELPDDLHAIARQLAHDANRSMSDVIVELIRRGLHRARNDLTTSARGMPLVHIGRMVTSSHVRSLDDE